MDQENESIPNIDTLRISKNRNTSDELGFRIEKMILSGDFTSGFRFPNENLFCQQLGVGRGTLREAYKYLESHGFITRTKRGTFVNEAEDIARGISLEVKMRNAPFSELLEFRIMFECENAYLAAKRATNTDIKNMRTSIKGMEEMQDPLEQTKYDTEFHMNIAKATHNTIIETSMYSIIFVFKDFVYKSLKGDDDVSIREHRIKKAIEFHRRILTAIENKDAKAARDIMRDHIMDVHGPF